MRRAINGFVVLLGIILTGGGSAGDSSCTDPRGELKSTLRDAPGEFVAAGGAFTYLPGDGSDRLAVPAILISRSEPQGFISAPDRAFIGDDAMYLVREGKVNAPY